jgi:hypothetical protein
MWIKDWRSDHAMACARPFLYEQYGSSLSSYEFGSQDAACGACTDNDVVVFAFDIRHKSMERQ